MSIKEEGKKRRGNPNPVTHRIPEERYVAARVLYETTPGMTFDRCAEETGISSRSLEDRSSADGGWTKRNLLPPTGMSDAAQQVADRYTGKLADYGDDISADQKQMALKDTAAEVAVDLRAQLLDRHRKEWQPIRNRVYKQLDPRTTMDEKARFEMAKTTKINAETLAILQLGERKAWGLDKPGEGDTPGGVTVVIERS